MPRLMPISVSTVLPGFLNSKTSWGLAIIAVLTTGWQTAALSQSSTAPGPSQDSSLAYPTISEGRIVRPTLRLGSQGDSVKELQSMLVLLGYYPGPVSGLYQENTQTAVRRFQEAAGITPDGIVGPATWSSLLPVPSSEGNPPAQAGTSSSSTTTTTTSSSNTTAPSPSTTPPATNGSSGSQPTTPAPEPSTSQPSANRPILRPGMEGDAVRQLQSRLKELGFYTGPIDGIFGSQTEAAVRRAQTENSLEVDGIVGPATWDALY
jgi:N-acetylmuramoyl-L-alanine amidase